MTIIHPFPAVTSDRLLGLFSSQAEEDREGIEDCDLS